MYKDEGAISRGSPGLVAPMRALPCARQSRSMAAQLVAFDLRCCAVSAGCTAPLVFLPTSALDPERHGLASHTRAAPGVFAQAARACRHLTGDRARTQSRTFGGRGRRAGFGHDVRAWHEAICLPCPDFAEDSLAASQLNFTPGDARRIWAWHLGVAYDAERGQHHEDRSAAPAANKRRVRSNVREPVDLRRSTDAV